MSLDSSTTTRHLLDEDFSEVFSKEDEALRAILKTFRDSLDEDELARQSSAFQEVEQALRRLGDRRSFIDEGAGLEEQPDI